MKTVSLTLYDYDELSPEAKEKALNEWNEHNDDPFMQSHMINLLKEKLDERGVKYDVDSMDVRYSFSHSQDDGFMFEGNLQWKGSEVQVKHSGHYYHMFSRTETWYDADGNETEPAHEVSFEKMYQEVCTEMEQIGYDYIEYMQSEESFRESCEANEYTFEADGTMRNA